jgi:hypothetical protein
MLSSSLKKVELMLGLGLVKELTKKKSHTLRKSPNSFNQTLLLLQLKNTRKLMNIGLLLEEKLNMQALK